MYMNNYPIILSRFDLSYTWTYLLNLSHFGNSLHNKLSFAEYHSFAIFRDEHNTIANKNSFRLIFEGLQLQYIIGSR